MLVINTGNIHTKREWTGVMTQFRSAVGFIANYGLDWCVHPVSLRCFFISRNTDWTDAFTRFRWTNFHAASYRLNVFVTRGTPSNCMQVVLETRLQNWYLSSKKNGLQWKKCILYTLTPKNETVSLHYFL